MSSLPADAELVAMHVVYGVLFRPLGASVYIGSSSRLDGEREAEHSDLRGGARRVAVAFAQLRWQPLADHFAFQELWRGECTLRQLKAVEQFMMDRHNTRVERRPTDGVARDVDLMREGAEPMQLNVTRACADAQLLEWARQRVERDSAIVRVLTPTERERTRHAFELERLHLEEVAEATAVVAARRLADKYAALPGRERVGVKEIHTDLNRVYTALSPDDGDDVRRLCRAKLLAFNEDRCPGEAWPAAVVRTEVAALQEAMGSPGALVNVSDTTLADKCKTVDEALYKLVERVCDFIKPHTGSTIYAQVSYIRIETRPCLVGSSSIRTTTCVTGATGRYKEARESCAMAGCGSRDWEGQDPFCSEGSCH